MNDKLKRLIAYIGLYGNGLSLCLQIVCIVLLLNGVYLTWVYLVLAIGLALDAISVAVVIALAYQFVKQSNIRRKRK